LAKEEEAKKLAEAKKIKEAKDKADRLAKENEALKVK